MEAGSTKVYETRRQPEDSIHQRENRSKPPTSGESGDALTDNTDWRRVQRPLWSPLG